MQQIIMALLAVCFLAATQPTEAKKLYKWSDTDEVVHYTALPPFGVEAEIFHVRVYRAKQQAPDSNKVATADTEGNQPTEQEQVSEIKKRNCKIARTNLDSLETHPRIYITDEKSGEKNYLSPEEHAARIQSTRKEIKQYCY